MIDLSVPNGPSEGWYSNEFYRFNFHACPPAGPHSTPPWGPTRGSDSCGILVTLALAQLHTPITAHALFSAPFFKPIAHVSRRAS